jgi:uncharacterized caspase-like protein
LNLRYPADEAEALAQAVRLGAEALCGADNMDFTVLTSRQTKDKKLPNKQNVRDALERVAAHSTRNDLLFVFFAGHGATPSNDRRSYFFLTQDARSAAVDIADKLRDATSISSQELVTWLRNPKAARQAGVDIGHVRGRGGGSAVVPAGSAARNRGRPKKACR